MKKNYILTLVMTLCLTVTSFGQEMMLNGGFESWELDMTPTDWFRAEGVIKSTDANTGVFSAKQINSATSGNIRLTQIIPGVIAGESYTITFWYNIAADAGSVVKM